MQLDAKTYSASQQRRALNLWVVMHRALAALSKISDADIQSRGFTTTEWGVLEYLYHKGSQPLVKIGQKILITSGSVTYVIDKLETKGFLERIPSDTDRRVIYASLTEKGRAVMKREFPHHAEAITRMLDILSADEQRTLARLLKKVGRASG